jgi:DNA-binding MarR family transcriptional regulator
MSPDYEALAEFRYRLRVFLHLSEAEARRHGLEPQQHQLLLAVKGSAGPTTLGYLAERMQLRHHSLVGLVDRLEARDLLLRQKDPEDHRRVFVQLTARGDKVLEELSLFHEEEISLAAPSLVQALDAIVESASRRKQAT